MQKALNVIHAIQSYPSCDPPGELPSDPIEACVRLFPAYAMSNWHDQVEAARAEFSPELEMISKMHGAMPNLDPSDEDFIRLGMRAAEEAEGAERLKWLRFVDYVASDRKALATFWME